MILVAGNIRFVAIFAGVPLGGGVKWEWGGLRQLYSAI